MTTPKRTHTRDDLLLILSYMRAIGMINSHCYRSTRNTNIIDLARFIHNMGMTRTIIE